MNFLFHLYKGISVLAKGKILNIIWVWLFVFFLGELLFYTIEKVIGLNPVTRWYDIVWLLVIYFNMGLNMYVLFEIMYKRK